MWDNFAFLFEHKGQEPIFLLPHLTRLDGVASELVQSHAAKDITLLGIFQIILCHVTEVCSSIRRVVNFLCRVSSLTFAFHLSRTSCFIDCLYDLLAMFMFLFVAPVPA